MEEIKLDKKNKKNRQKKTVQANEKINIYILSKNTFEFFYLYFIPFMFYCKYSKKKLFCYSSLLLMWKIRHLSQCNLFRN